MAPTSRKILPSLEGRRIRDITPKIGKPNIGGLGAAFPAPGPPVPVGWARLESNAGHSVQTLLGEEAPAVTGGYGGWEEIARPRKKPIVQWTAGVPFRLSLALMFDGFLVDVSVEPFLAQLEGMARRGDGDEEPPRVRVTLPAGLPRPPSVAWVIEDIEWGDALRDTGGARVRQACSVSLVEHVGDQLIKESPAKKRRKRDAKDKKGGSKTYTVKKGESAREIASRFGLSVRELLDANDLRDPDRVDVGDKLKIPPKGKKK